MANCDYARDQAHFDIKDLSDFEFYSRESLGSSFGHQVTTNSIYLNALTLMQTTRDKDPRSFSTFTFSHLAVVSVMNGLKSKKLFKKKCKWVLNRFLACNGSTFKDLNPSRENPKISWKPRLPYLPYRRTLKIANSMAAELNSTNEEGIRIVRSMPETGIIIAFCEKFKSFMKGIDFWPEELERALVDQGENDLIEQLHCTFLSNCLNRTKQVARQSWRKLLSDTIDQKLKKSYQFYQDFNPLRRVKSYYELDVKDKVLILNNLINWQLQDSKDIRRLIEEEYRNAKKNQENALEVEPYGEDRRGRKYYYFGKGARLYREKVLHGKGNKPDKYTFEAITSTIEDIENYVKDPKELKASMRKDKKLYNKLVGELIPSIKEAIEAKERRDARRLRQEKFAQKVALLHANSEIVASRTRSGTRKALGLEPYQRSASTISSASSNKPDDEYSYSSSTHMTRAKSVRDYVKRKYLESSTDDEEENSHYSGSRRLTRSRTSKRSRSSTVEIIRQETDDLDSLLNGVSNLKTENGKESNGVSLSRSGSIRSNATHSTDATELFRENFGPDSETSVSEKVPGSGDYKEVFGTDSGNELSEPSSSSDEDARDSDSDFKLNEDGSEAEDEALPESD
ncbi:15396_t:CDS:2 [Acaulospora morrowiae]|uniref:15396_t:CDS:1 n=1 Tax=Acaulospora morrowiae TaxID=94023 RepID=A0A9N8ZR23_9GLOM|nr:15396_t:CDS:2 [Acaulospora morrowiae]